MIIELPEWGTVSGLELDQDQVAALARTDAFTLRPDPAAAQRWQLSASQFVGVAHVGDLQIRVTPKIPVHRLLELLCISQDRIRWDDRNTQWEESDDLFATVARSFVTQAERVLQRGLVQGYVTIDESMFGIRGRVAISRQLARNPGLPLPVEVTYDDYTVDVVENQLLAGAGRLLLRLKTLPASITSRLRRLEYLLLDVTPTPPSSSPPQITWTRLNQRYRPAITLAHLILRSAALEFDGEHPAIGDAFLVDMNKVFEDVVGLGIRRALQLEGLTVELQRHDHLDHLGHVEIRPDVLVSAGLKPVAVADVKYKRPATSGLSTGDLYQAVAYATRYGLDRCTLVYAEPPLVSELRVGDITLRLTSIDLATTPDVRSGAIDALSRQLAEPHQHIAWSA